MSRNRVVLSFYYQGMVGEAKVSCSFCHWGASLILATVGQGLLSLQQVRAERVYCYFFCSFTFFHVPLSSLSLSFISSTISFLPFSGRWRKMTYKGRHVVKPQHNHFTTSECLKNCWQIGKAVDPAVAQACLFEYLGLIPFAMGYTLFTLSIGTI